MKLIVSLIVNTFSILLAAYLIPDVYVDSVATALVVAIVLGILNTFIKPLLTILTLPITLLTLGLFAFVINAALVLLAGYITPGFTVATVLAAFLFSIAVSLINSFLGTLTK